MAIPKGLPVLRALSYLEAGVNPYLYDENELLKFSNWQKVQIALGTVFLLPIRTLIIIIMMVIAWPMALIIKMRLKSGTDIYKGWRRNLCRVLISFGRVALVCLGYWRIKVKGKPASREEAPVLVVPLHSSWLDFLATAIVDGQVIPIALHREENKSIPFFHTMVVTTQQIYVSRTDAESRSSALQQVKERALDNRWPRLLIFPEGFCTNRKTLIPFKKGAFVAGCPIQPMVYRYPSDVVSIT
jgi:1-acyl-sn-glycerol-3-phosphate acyltransferase